MREIVKGLTEVQGGFACTAFPFSARPVISSYKVIELFKHDMPLVNPWWLFLIFLLLMSLKMVSRISWSSTFLGTEVRLVTSVPWVLLVVPPEDRCDFCFLIVFWYISYFNRLLRVVMPSATSLSTQKCIPPGPVGLFIPSFLKCAMIWSSSIKGMSSLLQIISLATFVFWSSLLHSLYRNPNWYLRS